MHTSRQQGFAALEALLVVIIVGLLGFTGWFVWHAKNNTDTSLNNASNSQPGITKKTPAKSTKTDNVTATWTTYTVKDKVFTVKYPSNWVQPTNKEACGGFLDQNLEIGPNEQSVIKCGGDGTVSQVSISWTTTDKGGSAGTNLALAGYKNYKSGTLIVDGVQGKTYSAVASQQSEGLDALPDGTIVIINTFEKAGKVVVAQYMQYPSTQKEGPTQDQQAVFNQIVSTLTFN